MRRLTYLILATLIGLALACGMAFYLKTSSALAQSAPDKTTVIRSALEYLKSQQQVDGGILGFSQVSDPDTTARAVLAFATAGEPVNGVLSSGGKTMLDYLSTQMISYTHDTTGTLFPGRAGLILSAISLAGDLPADFGGMDLVAELQGSYHADTGEYSTTAQQGFSSGKASEQSQALVILGLTLDGQPIPHQASQYLAGLQAEDGSWGAGDPDTTAIVVTALLTSRVAEAKDPPIQKALGFFKATQLPSGGWKPSWDTDPLNADSTGWILQALLSAGEDPTGATWVKDKTNPVEALLGMQKPDGSIGGTYANTYSTAEAIIGLVGMPFSDIRIHPPSHQAGLIIFYGNGSVFTDCVSFPESSLTGLELLQRSGLRIETATNPNQGSAVCMIDKVGDVSSDCFGSMPDYWSYWQGGASGWDYAVVGADQSQVINGDVNAWSWGTGDPPAIVTYQNICEGVPFVIPAATKTAPAPTETGSASTPTAQPTGPTATEAGSKSPSTPAATPSQAAPEPAGGSKGVGTYIVYASIILVLGALIVAFIISRRR